MPERFIFSPCAWLGVERCRKIVVLSCCLVLSCRRAPPPAARDPPITRSDRFSQLLLHHEPAAATHPSQVQTSSVNCFYITDRPPRPILCKRRPIQSIALISRTARRDPPIASSDQFSQLLLYHGPPPATHPSQDQTNSANCFYITDRPPRSTHRKIRPIQLIAFISRTARRDAPIARSDQFS